MLPASSRYRLREANIASWVGALILVVAACQPADLGSPVRAGGGNWPSFGYDHFDSLHNQTVTALSRDNVGKLAERWRLEAGAVSGTPIVVDGVVYYGDWHGVVRAVNAEDGDVIWEARVTDLAISATAAVTSEVVVVADLGDVVHALDRLSAEVV